MSQPFYDSNMAVVVDLHAIAKPKGWECFYDEKGDKCDVWLWKGRTMAHGFQFSISHVTGKGTVTALPVTRGLQSKPVTADEAWCWLVERMEEGRAA